MKQVVRKTPTLDKGIGKLGPRARDIHEDFETKDKEKKEKLPPRRNFGYSNRITVSRTPRYLNNETRS